MRKKMKQILAAAMIAGVLLGTGCFGNRAEEWYETAELEELQNSHDHARQLYQRIVDEYPDSDVAARARQRLEALKSRKP